jgi:hypothetical protein
MEDVAYCKVSGFLQTQSPDDCKIQNSGDILYFVRVQVLTAASMTIVVFWYVAPCSLADTDQRFRGAYCPHYQGDDWT